MIGLVPAARGIMAMPPAWPRHRFARVRAMRGRAEIGPANAINRAEISSACAHRLRQTDRRILSALLENIFSRQGASTVCAPS